MGLGTMFGFGNAGLVTESTELPDIFPLKMTVDDFIRKDTFNIYLKILTDVIERTHNLNDEAEASLWDNCLQNESNDGLITLLAKAMSEKTELVLIYDKALKVLRKAKSTEAQQIKEDYKAKGESPLGIYLSFTNYARTDMVRLYAGLEYAAVASLHKTMNISKALQIKVADLRGAVALSDSATAIAQAKQVAKSLGDGKDVLTDAKDIIETSVPNIAPTTEAMEFINQKRSFYLGLPASYFTGVLPGGLGDSGEGDSKAVERGLKPYFFSIIKPVIEEMFAIKVTFKSHDFRQIGSALEALKTFDILGDELISFEQKKSIISNLLDLDLEESRGAKRSSTDTETDSNDSAAIPAGRASDQQSIA